MTPPELFIRREMTVRVGTAHYGTDVRVAVKYGPVDQFSADPHALAARVVGVEKLILFLFRGFGLHARVVSDRWRPWFVESDAPTPDPG